MRRISAIEQQIRDHVNEAGLYDRYFRNHHDEWTALCVAMDTLGDTCLALEHYEEFGIGNRDGEKYLALYGLLQAIFLQEDSIRQLHQALLGTSLRPESESAWMEIRNLRNMTVGHPMKNDQAGIKRCFISRVSLCSTGFQLLVWDKDTEETEFEDIELSSLYDRYKAEAIHQLEMILQARFRR